MEKLTRFETARIIGARTLQLSLGAPPLVKLAKVLRMEDIAIEEFNRKVIPLSVLRKYPNGQIKKIEIA